MGAKTFLFSGDSLQPTSPTFYLDAPLTLTATNLQQGEEIRFERITLRAGDPGKVCGCYVEHMRKADVESIEPLRCPTCDSADEQFVRLTYRNPIAVLNFPLGSLLRAVYVAAEGEDPEAALGTILVWYEGYNGSADLDPHHTGCPEVCCEDKPEIWHDTGQVRCNIEDDVLEIEQVSNCGDLRWVEGEALGWTPTGETRCDITAGLEEIQEVNNCGDLRWVEGEALGWTPTGETRCDITADLEEIQEVNNCGDLRWVEGEALGWTPTGETRCDITADLEEIQEVNTCGDLRWVEGEALVWTPTGETRCDITADLEEIQEVNTCGDLRWVEGEALVWTPTGVTHCDLEADVEEVQEVNTCGDLRWVEGEALAWTETGLARCNMTKKLVEHQQVNTCGDLRWTEEAGSYCGYVATIPLPDGGLMFEDGEQPPDATVAVRDCDDNVLGWLYPDAREGASTPVTEGCGQGGDCGAAVIGYAVDGGQKEVVPTDIRVIASPKRAVQVITNCSDGKARILWSDGSLTKAVTDCKLTGPVPGPEIDLSNYATLEQLTALQTALQPLLDLLGASDALSFLTTDATNKPVWSKIQSCNNKNILGE